MKKKMLSALMLLCTLSGFAQDIPAREVPSVVMNVFNQKFPKAADVEWERKGELYKVEFEISRKDHSLWINESGNVVKHKEDIRSADLPAAVKTVIAKDYKGYRIDDVEKLQNGKGTFYKVELKKGSEDVDVFFDQQGKKMENIKM